MGFINSKPLSIEGVFSEFDTDGNGKISRKEAKAAKNMDVFTNFKVEKGMTLETFESENRDVYARYEQNATEAYNKQEAKVKKWLEQEQDAMFGLQDDELKKLEELEKEMDKERAEIELELAKQKFRKDTENFVNNLPIDEIVKLAKRYGIPDDLPLNAIKTEIINILAPF